MKYNSLLKKSTLILMYHGIANVENDPWSVFVTPSRFSEQIEVLNKYFQTISLSDALVHPNNGSCGNSVVITFDDGYANNLTAAKSMLKEFGMPATFFIISGMVGSDREFWWDELEQIIFNNDYLPDELEIDLGNRTYIWKNNDPGQYEPKIPCYWWENPPSSRHGLFLDLWSEIRLKNPVERMKILDTIVEWSGLKISCRETHRVLGIDELKELSDEDLFEIGSHTKNHIPLTSTSLSDHQVYEELSGSRNRLEELTDKPIINLSYPFGDFNSNTITSVRKSGYKCALTTEKAVFSNQSNTFTVPRYQVCNWDGNRFFEKIQQSFNSPQ